MNLHAVESGTLGIFGRSAIIGDDARDFIGGQSARRHIWPFRSDKTDMPIGCDCGRCDGQSPIQKHGIGNPTDVPKLEENPAPRRMDRRGDEFPAFNLVFGPDAGCLGVADPHGGYGSRFAQDQSGRCSLGVVFRHQFVGNTFVSCSAARQGGHNDAVGQFKGANGDRIKKCRHVIGPLSLDWLRNRFQVTSVTFGRLRSRDGHSGAVFPQISKQILPK